MVVENLYLVPQFASFSFMIRAVVDYRVEKIKGNKSTHGNHVYVAKLGKYFLVHQ